MSSQPYFNDLKFLGADELPRCAIRIDQAFPASLALNYMPTGRISFTVADGPTAELGGPMGFWIHGEVHHRYWSVDPRRAWHLQWVMVSGPRMQRLIQGGVAPHSPSPFRRPAEPTEFAARMHRLVQLVRHGRREDQRQRVHLFEALFAELTGGEMATAGDSPTEATRGSLIDRLAKRMADDPGQVFDLEAWARQHGISYHHLRRQFTKRIGSSPTRYLIDCRMRWAAGRLAAGAGSVQAIAAAAGYPNPFNFSRIFRQRMGFPPRRLLASRG